MGFEPRESLFNQSSHINMLMNQDLKWYHEKISHEYPHTVIMVENELKNKANDRKLKKGSENGVKHFSLKAQLLKI